MKKRKLEKKREKKIIHNKRMYKIHKQLRAKK